MAIALSTSVGVRSSGATVAIPFGSANADGALLTLVVTSVSSGGVISTVTDSAGNTWTLAVNSTRVSPAVGSQIWYAANALPSTNTLTVTNNETAVAIQCFAQEWSGCSTTAPLLSTNAAQLTGASTHTPGAATIDVSTALFLVNYSFTSAFDITAGPSGYTQANSTFSSMETYYLIHSGSTVTSNPEVTSSATETTANVIAAFSGAAAASATVSRRRMAMRLLGVS